MTPNIASVISSASNANGSASAFLFAAASEPEAAFSAPFPEAYARRTTTERQSQTIHIDPAPRALLSPPPRAHESPVSRRASRRVRIRVVPRIRARVRVDFSPLSSSSRVRLRVHRRDTITRRQSPHTSRSRVHTARARLSSSFPNDRLVPSRPPSSRARAIARHRPLASPRASLSAVTPREHSHAPSLELARGTDALRFVARVMIPPPRAIRRRVRARPSGRSPQPYSSLVSFMYVIMVKDRVY